MLFLFVSLLACRPLIAQQIEYSIPLGDNIRTTSFQVIGRCQQNLMVYKRSYNTHEISLYDDHLKIRDEIPLDFLPTEVKEVDFINLGDHVLMIYQYMEKRDVYCKAVSLGQDARPLDTPQLISRTLHPDQIVGNKAYAVIHSEDKSQIMCFEILRNEDSLLFHIRTFLYDSTMQLRQRDMVTVPYRNQEDRLDLFQLSNDGSLYFILGTKGYPANDYYQSVKLYLKPEGSDRLSVDSLPLAGHLPRTSLLLKIDELHQKICIDALAYDGRLRDIDRLLTFRFSKTSLDLLQQDSILFTDSLKTVVRGKRGGVRQTFDDYRLTQTVIDQHENQLVIAEERYRDANGVLHYDQIVLFDISAEGVLRKLQKIPKEQGDDLIASAASYLLVNAGQALHLLVNKSHRVFRFLNNYVYLLADYQYGADRELREMPVMRGLDNKYLWAIRHGVQVSRHEVVVPCISGSNLLFGKITY